MTKAQRIKRYAKAIQREIVDWLPENVNYGVKSSFLTALLESLPDVSAKLVDPNTKARSPEKIAQMVQAATVLVFVE